MTARVARGIARRTGVSVKYLDPADGRMCIALAGPSAPLKAWRTERADRKRAELVDTLAALEALPLRDAGRRAA